MLHRLAGASVGRGPWLALAALAAACGTNPPPPPPPPAPQVFLTVTETNVFGKKITGTTNVTGCKTVQQVQILTDNEAFLADANYTGANSVWEIPGSNLNRYYSERGLALPLSLWAKVICDDGRFNKSQQPVSVTFFPVDSVLQTSGGQALPDSFVAEGGLGGTPVTFIGCVANGSVGVQLARVDLNADIVQSNQSLPFPCTVNSVISDRSTGSGMRWLFEPGAGAFAFDSNLNITAIVTGSIKQLAVVKSDGHAIMWDDTVNAERLIHATPRPSGGNTVLWSKPFPGIMNSLPVVDTGNRKVWTSSWQYNIGTHVGNIVAIGYDYDSGLLLKDPPDVLVQQNFAALGDPVTPRGTFTTDGQFLALPLMGVDITTNTVKTTVLLCATNTAGCENAARRWTSPFFNGIVSTVLLFGNGSYFAAAGAYQTWFLSAADGKPRNLGSYPAGVLELNQNAAIRPSGSLVTLFVQPGVGQDFYVLNGPNMAGAYPTQIVGLDSPEQGELWRIDYGGGESPLGSMYLATDDTGLPWLRIGPDRIKPLPNREYRTVRGATPMP